jgi:hypothetical protein
MCVPAVNDWKNFKEAVYYPKQFREFGRPEHDILERICKGGVVA